MKTTRRTNRPGARSLGGLFTLCVAATGFSLAPTSFAQAKPATPVSKDVSLVPVVGEAKARLLRTLAAKTRRQSHSPTHHECPGGDPHIQEITCGSTHVQQLATTDCVADGFYGDFYSFSASGGTIAMNSSVVDAYLVLFDDEQDLEAEDNDSGEGTNSLITFTSNATTTWYVVATSSRPGELGAYTLTLQCSAEPPCVEDSTTLCLNNGRFRVQANWAAPNGTSGAGTAVPETTDTGMFWFFSANNIEMIIKVVNGCGFNQRYWVFAGGLTNVQVVITVTDTANGTTKTYTNPQGTAFAPIQDTDAFATCP